MGEPGDDWDRASDPADDNDPDPDADIHTPNPFGGQA